MNIVWNVPSAAKKPALHFGDLDVNDTFKLTTGEAVYVKVSRRVGSTRSFDRHNEEYMLELATGRLFGPSSSPVARVGVTVNVDVPKPSLY